MNDRTASRRFAMTADKWRRYAEKRRDDIRDLHTSGRWRRYYSEEDFLALVRDIARSCERWDKIAENMRLSREAGGHFPERKQRSAA
jgi:hypothetical protein